MVIASLSFHCPHCSWVCTHREQHPYNVPELRILKCSHCAHVWQHPTLKPSADFALPVDVPDTAHKPGQTTSRPAD